MPKNSLSKKKDFDQIFKTGQSFYCSFLGIKALKNDLDVNRLGIIIGLKVSKVAVIRNKIKRQIREIVKKFPKKKDNYDFLIIVKKEILNKDFKEIKEEILKLQAKIK